MNDYELGRQRQEHQRKYGIEKGFPVFLLTTWDCKTGKVDVELYITHKGLITRIESFKNEKLLYKADIKHVKDVKKVSYETV